MTRSVPSRISSLATFVEFLLGSSFGSHALADQDVVVQDGPEGTPIKAAEDGVVAYAGNELKTYGNLVLVRHANGYVTAYAHASEILVKRDEHVKRGQVIGKAGQTGSVNSPPSSAAPSMTSSAVMIPPFRLPVSSAYRFSPRTRALRKPDSCVPPSAVGTVLQ